MEQKLAEEIIACLPSERTQFGYFKDQYALYLLKRYLQAGSNSQINSLRQSRVKKLLERPVVKDVLKNTGKGVLELAQLEQVWPTAMEHYVLTLGCWGDKSRYSWNQTTRPGVNLVLQLNLNNQFEGMFKRLAGCALNQLTTSHHPKSHKRSATLAWARLDLDFVTGEVLIEEIQSDLIRDLEYAYKRAVNESSTGPMRIYWSRERLERNRVASACHVVLQAQKKIWAEAMLAATLWFVHCELGFNTIYYHSFDTGRVMKKIPGTAPPKSLYTDLPEKFCFEVTRCAPQFIVENPQALRRLKSVMKPQWYLLAG
jgi:hypothetical protein